MKIWIHGDAENLLPTIFMTREGFTMVRSIRPHAFRGEVSFWAKRNPGGRTSLWALRPKTVSNKD